MNMSRSLLLAFVYQHLHIATSEFHDDSNQKLKAALSILQKGKDIRGNQSIPKLVAPAYYRL
jgi:hypothetical protein